MTELDLERSLWDLADWSWVAVFVRVEVATRPPRANDVWVQVLTLETVRYEEVATSWTKTLRDPGMWWHFSM